MVLSGCGRVITVKAKYCRRAPWARPRTDCPRLFRMRPAYRDEKTDACLYRSKGSFQRQFVLNPRRSYIAAECYKKGNRQRCRKARFSFISNASSEDVGGYCISPGDPGRCAAIARKIRSLGSNRNHMIYAGNSMEAKSRCVSTGIKTDRPRRYEELANLGVHTFIRVGTLEDIDLDVLCGDPQVVASGL